MSVIALSQIILPCYCGETHCVRDPRVKTYLRCRRCGAYLLYECDGRGEHRLRGLTGERLLTEPEIVVGQNGDWKINHPSLSRRHCQLTLAGDAYEITDLNSRNGTYVNNERIYAAPRRLDGGDLVRLADLTFRYLSPKIGGTVAPLTPNDLLGTKLDLPEAALDYDDRLLGKTLNGYRLSGLLSQGGMGRLYFATNEAGDSRAVKVILPRGQSDGDDTTTAGDRLQRFIQEMALSIELRHSHIVACYDIGQLGTVLYIQMEYFTGRNLRRWFAERPATPEQVIAIGAPAARALAYAHRQGVIHRDIKPENIMYRDDGVVKVIDFGIAKAVAAAEAVLRADETRETVHLGTLRYMAPEQLDAAGKVSPQSDIYSLGATLFFCLAGCSPYENSDDGADLRAAMTREPADITRFCKGVPAKLADVINTALATKPIFRFGTAEEMAAALEQAR
ncbi:MAG: protein kinase [Planctomycetota bacterium]|jgi:hypothetical protein|nr:protein kinase [Planctomycetota bacterium]